MSNFPGQSNHLPFPSINTSSTGSGSNQMNLNLGMNMGNSQFVPHNDGYPNCQHDSNYSQINNPNPNVQNAYASQSSTTTNIDVSVGVRAPYPNFQQPNNQYSNIGIFPNNSSQSMGYPPGMQPIPGGSFLPQMSVPNGSNNLSQGVNSIGVSYYGNKAKERYIPTTLRPTLQANLGADPAADAQALNKAYKGLGCNKEAVRNIIARRNCGQRERIKQEYNKKFGKSLIEHTKSELTEPYERIIISLLWTGADLDAFMLYKASKGIGTDDASYRDIICTRSFAQLTQIKASYQNGYSKCLENIVSNETSGCFKDILLHLLANPRDQSPTVDLDLAKRDATHLFTNKSLKITAPSSLIDIFAKRSNMQLLQTFIAYQEMSGKTVYHYLKQFISSDYQKCLMTIHNFIVNPIRYYSKLLRQGIINKSINQIIRIVTTRCEFDIFTIIEDYNFTYKTNFGNDLRNALLHDAGEDTLDTIYMLIGAK